MAYYKVSWYLRFYIEKVAFYEYKKRKKKFVVRWLNFILTAIVFRCVYVWPGARICCIQGSLPQESSSHIVVLVVGSYAAWYRYSKNPLAWTELLLVLLIQDALEVAKIPT